MIGAEALGQRLTSPRLIEHAADADAVNMGPFNTESDDATRENVHDNHHPKALQRDGLTSEKIDAP